MLNFEHIVNTNGYSNLYGYGMPDLARALGLDINQNDLGKLKESEFNNNVSLNYLNALEAWKAGYTGEGVRVGVIDGGEGLNVEAAIHEFSDLTIRIDTVAARGAHGFRVAQYIVGKNHLPENLGGNGEKSETGSADSRDVTGVAFDAELYFADPDLSDLDIFVRESHIFGWFIDKNVDVINWSGSLGYDNSWHQEALRLAHENGIIVVMAAGNSGAAMDGFRSNDILRYVKDYDNMIVASALRPEEDIELYGFSNHAGDVEHNHFSVIEDYSHAYFPSGEYENNVNGTSFAAPYLTGVVALIIQKLREEGNYDNDKDYLKVIDLLVQSSEIPNEENLEIIEDTNIIIWDGTYRNLPGTAGDDLVISNRSTDEIVEIVLNEPDNLLEIYFENSDSEFRFNYNGIETIKFNDGKALSYFDHIETEIDIIYSLSKNQFIDNESIIGFVVDLINDNDRENIPYIANRILFGHDDLNSTLLLMVENVYGIEKNTSQKFVNDLLESKEINQADLFWSIVDSDTVDEQVDAKIELLGNNGFFVYDFTGE